MFTRSSSDRTFSGRGSRSIQVTAFLLALAMLGPVIWWMGAANPVTPAGYVGYLTKGAVFGKSRFYGTQRGPTSAGRTWLLRVTNVSVTPYTYTEDFTKDESVLSRSGPSRGTRSSVGTVSK